MLRKALDEQIAAYRKAKKAADAYGGSVADYAKAHADAERALAVTKTRMDALNKAQAYKAKRQEAARSLTAATAGAAIFSLPVKQAIEFESAMADAAKTIEGMRDDSGKLTDKYYSMESAIKEMGRSLPLTHDQLARLFAAGGQQGMTDVGELQEFTEMAAHMSVAFGMSTEEAADAIGGYRSALKLSMPEARELLDLMNQYANTTSASEQGIADVVRRVGSLGSVGGIAAKPMTALAATLDAMKVSPEVAATGIKNLILAMTAGNAATKKQKETYAELGIDTVKLAKQMQQDGPAAIISVLEAIEKLPKAQQLSTMQEIFGKESLGFIAPLLANLDQVKKNLLIVGDTSAYAGAMQNEFANRSDTTANKLIIFGNQLRELAITVAGNLLPAVQGFLATAGPAISTVAAWMGEHKKLTTVIIGAAGGLVAMKVAGAALMWLMSGTAGVFSLAKAAIAGFAVAQKIATAGQWLLNAALTANPIGLAISAVAALSAGMVYLYRTCEPVRAAFDSVFGWIGNKIGWAWSKLKSMGKFFGLGGGEDKPDDAEPGTAKVYAASPTASALPDLQGPPAVPDMPDFAASSSPGLAFAPQGMNVLDGKAAPLQPSVQVSMQFSLNGMPESSFAEGVVRSLREKQAELEQIISGIVHNQARLAYGG